MKQDKANYQPESYWSEVAKRVKSRSDKNIIAGDDEPFYRYKRAEFLKMLRQVDFRRKKVLEVGPGPGGNLNEIYQLEPAALHGADISQEMINLATQNLAGKNIQLVKVDGKSLPFEDQFFDVVTTVTVLQHNTDQQMLENVIAEICRVTKDKVVIFEQTNPTLKGDELCYWRPIEDYKALFGKHGLELIDQQFINIYTSYLICGAIRKGLNPKNREEGEPLNQFSLFLENITLPVTKVLDKVFPAKTDLTKMVFKKV